MKNRWLNLLFFLLIVLIVSMMWHLFVFAKTTAAASLIINILKPLNILLFVILFFVLSRNLIKLYLGRKGKVPGSRLSTRLILAILPLTLIPSLLLFILATRFVDDILFNQVIDPNMAQIIENSDRLNGEYLEDLRRLHLGHAKALLKLGLNQSELVGYLDRHGLQGVELFENGTHLLSAFASDFPAEATARVRETVNRADNDEPALYDDGFFILRFSFESGQRGARFVFSKKSPFTERFLFIRDSFTFLKHARKKTEKLKGLNQGILLVTTLGLIFGGVWTGLIFSRKFMHAFNVLIAGAKQVAEGNLETRIELKTGDEIEEVVGAFNSMTRTLKNNRRELEQKAGDLARVNTALSGQIQYNRTILQEINAGILSTDSEDRIQTFNPAAKRILNLTEPPGYTVLLDLLDAKRHRPLIEHWQDFKRQGSSGSFRQLDFPDADERQTLHVASAIVPLLDEDEPFGSLIVLEDLTQLFHAQKLAAWREVAKRVAHEIKNPLTPIQLSMQRIHRKARNHAPDLETAIESAVETVMSETALLKNLVDEFSTFAKLPSPLKIDTDMGELVKSVCNSYKPVFPEIEIQASLGSGHHMLLCDPSQMRQVLANLINNAVQASKKGGRVVVDVTTQQGFCRLSVADEGVGIPASQREQVFLPYYSRSPKGTGLGLAIVKRIVEDHGGTVGIAANEPRGTRFMISLPHH